MCLPSKVQFLHGHNRGPVWLSCGRRDHRRVACVWLDCCVTEMRESSLCGPLSGCPHVAPKSSGFRVDTGEPFTLHSLQTVPCPSDFQSPSFWQRYGIRTPQSIQLLRSRGSLPRVYWRMVSGSQKPIQRPKGGIPSSPFSPWCGFRATPLPEKAGPGLFFGMGI